MQVNTCMNVYTEIDQSTCTDAWVSCNDACVSRAVIEAFLAVFSA